MPLEPQSRPTISTEAPEEPSLKQRLGVPVGGPNISHRELITCLESNYSGNCRKVPASLDGLTSNDFRLLSMVCLVLRNDNRTIKY